MFFNRIQLYSIEIVINELFYLSQFKVFFNNMISTSDVYSTNVKSDLLYNLVIYSNRTFNRISCEHFQTSKINGITKNYLQ